MLRRFWGSSGPPKEASTERWTRSRVTVSNGTDHLVTLILEPWCDTFDLRPDESFTVYAQSPRAGWLQVEHGNGHVTISAWAGCLAHVYGADGQDVSGASATHQVPDLDMFGMTDEADYREP